MKWNDDVTESAVRAMTSLNQTGAARRWSHKGGNSAGILYLELGLNQDEVSEKGIMTLN